jgi:hypothetical protein
VILTEEVEVLAVGQVEAEGLVLEVDSVVLVVALLEVVALVEAGNSIIAFRLRSMH